MTESCMTCIYSQLTKEQYPCSECYYDNDGNPSKHEPVVEALCWKYSTDEGSLMAVCPKCEGRMLIGPYRYENPYSYCPYCGEKLENGDLESASKKIYGWEWLPERR